MSNAHLAPNPISIRFEKLVELWESFTTPSQVRIVIMELEEDEHQMMDTFFKFEGTEHKKTQDLYFQLNAPFEEKTIYPQNLLEEVQEFVSKWNKSYLENPSEDEYTTELSLPQPGQDEKKDESFFLKNMMAIREQFPAAQMTPDYRLVLVPKPLELENPKSFKDWVEGFSEIEIPGGLLLLLIDSAQTPFYDLSFDRKDKRVVRIRPGLDMESAISQLAGQGDPLEPGVQLRKLIVEMQMKAQKNKLEEVEGMVPKAVQLCEKEDWFYMIPGIHTLLGNTYMANQKFDEALVSFREGKKAAIRAIERNGDAYTELLIHSNMAIGALFFVKKDYELAVSAYKDSLEASIEYEKPFFVMESFRMMGSCLIVAKKKSEAWDAFWNALNSAEDLEEETRRKSTLPYTGDQLLLLCKSLNRQEHIEEIEQKLNTYCGPNWRDKVIQTKKKRRWL